MLILTRRVGESLVISDNIVLTVLGVKGNQVRIGVNAPADITIHREEIYNKIQVENGEHDKVIKDTTLELELLNLTDDSMDQGSEINYNSKDYQPEHNNQSASINYKTKNQKLYRGGTFKQPRDANKSRKDRE